MPEQIPSQPDRAGMIVPDYRTINYLSRSIIEAKVNVQGDGGGNGTAIHTIKVENRKYIVIHDLNVYSHNGKALIKIVASDTNGVGGTETDLAVLDVDENIPSMPLSSPIFYYNDSGADRYIVIYAPLERGSSTSNNANTQYWSLKIQYRIF